MINDLKDKLNLKIGSNSFLFELSFFEFIEIHTQFKVWLKTLCLIVFMC